MAGTIRGKGQDEEVHFACFPHVYRGLPCVKRDCVVIRIRYRDFSAGTHDATGLHGRAERGPRGVTVYLVPGLTACQRRAVIRRLRQEASRLIGPPLPLPQLAVALGLDRVRSAARITGAIVRLHPAVTLLPGAFVAALMALFVIASADGPGLTAGQRAGLAAVAAVGPLMPQTVAVAVVPARQAGAGRTGLDAGHQALLSRPEGRPRSHAALPFRSPCAWCDCSPAWIDPVTASLPCQYAWGRSASRPALYTAHWPDPRAFAT
jgi:hypothetical protein